MAYDASNDRVFGADGTAHITYYDRETQLSFVYDTSKEDDDIAVSRGGYAEPVFEVFSAFDFDPGWGEGVTIADHLAAFEAICRAYISRMTDPVEIERALVRGFREGAGSVGMTFDGDPESKRSIAYDYGRTLRRQLDGIE